MDKAEFNTAINNFRLPLKPNEIEWKIQSNKNNNTIVVPYIDNRAAMKRLDECFGAENWCNSFTRWGNNKGVMCALSIRVDGVWITKHDGADESDIEPTKGGFSDSMKRACTQWGLGRDLYDYPKVMFEGEHKVLKGDMLSLLMDITVQILNGAAKDFYFLKTGQTPSEPQAATPQAQQPKADAPKDERGWLNKNTPAWENVVAKLKAKAVTIADVEKHYKLSKPIKEELQAIK